MAASAPSAPAAAPPQTTAVQQAAVVAQTITGTIIQAGAASGEADGEGVADGATDGAADAATPTASATPAPVTTVASPLGVASAIQGMAPAQTESAASTSPDLQQPPTPASPADAQPVDAPKADAKQQAQPAATPTQPASQPQMKAQAAPAADVAAQQPASANPPASTAHGAATDALTAPTGTADTARAPATPPALQSAPSATIQVYARIIERADGRAQRFEVRLDPAELGRVDVRIEIGADRKVHAVLAAHDSAALTDLMKGQRALERALADAGIDLADKGVRFELASDNGRGGAQTRDGDSARTPSQNVWRNFETASVAISAEAASVANPPAWRSQRLDLVA